MTKPTDEQLEKALADIKEGRAKVRDSDVTKRIMPPILIENEEEKTPPEKPKARSNDADFLGVGD